MIVTDQNVFSSGHTVSLAAQWSLSSPHSHCRHVGPTDFRDTALGLPGSLWLQDLCLCCVAWQPWPNVWSGVPSAFTHGRVMTSPWRSASGSFIRWSLIKRAHPHRERQVAVTSRAGRSHAGKVRSRCTASQARRSGVRLTRNWRVFQNKSVTREAFWGKRRWRLQIIII